MDVDEGLQDVGQGEPGATATGEDIVKFCKERLAAYKVPKSVEFRQSLPKSAVGKVLRKILRDEEQASRNDPDPVSR